MSSERRVSARYPLHLSAEIQLGSTRITATTRDVSEGGCCVESAYEMQEGSELSVSLFLVVDGVEDASMPPLQMASVVQWAAENEDAPLEARHLAGVRFSGATKEQKHWLSTFLAKQKM